MWKHFKLKVCVLILWTPKSIYVLDPLQMHVSAEALLFHLRCPIPDGSSVKCLWPAAPHGFLSTKLFAVLNVDCCDVNAKPQPGLLCVPVTIYFRPVCEKNSFFPHRCSLTRTLRWNTALLLLNSGPPPKQTGFCTHSKCATKKNKQLK